MKVRFYRLIMKKLFVFPALVLLALSLAIETNAQARYYIDGIYYITDYNAKTAMVSYPMRGTKYKGDVKIVSSFSGFTVIGVDAGAFKGCQELTSVLLPETIQSIGDSAFSGCAVLLRDIYSR